MEINKKIKIGILEIGTFSAITSKVNVKLKFWGYNEKNMGFHLTPKKGLLTVEPWGMRMQWEHTTLIMHVCWHFDHAVNMWCDQAKSV